ncbi:MAG: precorrin-2 C(20)-methyltransferase, partial [Actinomycetota bacterium]|nr:precorrin-2 C(20)-methyltransferase [Actinomycetota bacterium]
MAFQALASEASVLVTDDVETLRIVTGVNGVDDIAVALDDPSATVVVYKGGRHVKAIVDLLQSRDRLAGAVFGELLGLEGSVIAPLTDVSTESAAYLSTIIVPPRRSAP